MPKPLLLAFALAAACSGGADTTPRPDPDPTPPPREAPPPEPETEEEAEPDGFDVAPWQGLLDAYATEDGGFRYEALRANAADRARLAALVQAVGDADPSAWSRDARLAFYIDAYNVLVIYEVLRRWPLESVIRSDGFFDGATFAVAGEERTLNALENEVIRGDAFAEPRIHFAVNCASAGCPPLSRTAYTARNLEAQLAAQASRYVRETTRIDRAHDRVEVSQIFEWFGADFEPAGGVRAFVAAQLEAEDAAFVLRDETTIAHFEYDWTLNAR
jgi:hypothetical protein